MRPLYFAFAIALVSAAHAEDVLLSAVTNVRDAENEEARPALDKNAKNQPLRIAGQEFAKGLGAQVDNRLAFTLNGATRFAASVGVDDATSDTGTIYFEVLADGQSLWRRELKKGEAAVSLDVDVHGKHQLVLVSADIGNGYTQAFADWVDAKFTVEGDKPKSVMLAPLVEQPVILTPKPPAEPRLTGARVFGARPGNPFLFTVTATGERPVTFAADGLPAGLALDAATGRISGSVATPGTHIVTLHATNARGADEKKLRLEIGERIALTPALGWNSWNCWGPEVNAEKVLGSARAMVSSGLVHHGWTYINIDDAWQAARGGAHQGIQGNEKFPDLKKLADEIHALGLKSGIYSTPWITSYAGYIGGSANNPEGKWEKPAAGAPRSSRGIGKFSFAANDAKQWADWGIDYLKYDWNPNRLPETAEMWSALRVSGRDIVFSLSNSMPFQNIPELSHVANSWRTTGDITDLWGNMHRIGFGQDKWRPFGGPGHWNDPDMLVVGYVDVGKGRNLHPTRLTPNEQYTHLSLWCLQSAPLLIGCDMERLDEFTLSLLENDEVIAIDQDELGRPAAQTVVDGRKQVWVKELADGSRAIGFFNLAQQPQEISATWAQLGIEAKSAPRVRDLWRQQDLAANAEKFSTTVGRHGVMLIRVWPAK